ncbi:MAG TPA: aminopeptidase P N-terminal domain-containing protein [Longimicrobiales bacterium]
MTWQVADVALHAARRARVLQALGTDAVMVLTAAPEPRIGRDVELRYQPDPDLYYLTGYPEPDAVAVLAPARTEAPFTLFVRPRDPEAELWTGPRGGPDAAKDLFGADEAYPIGELADRLPPILAAADTIYFRLGTGRDDVEALVRKSIIQARRGRQREGRGPRTLVDPGAILDDMRLIKDEHEIALLREAARISAEAFREAARLIRPGAGEWEIEAALEAGFRSRGAMGPAFPTIVGAGANATVLHYTDNAAPLQAGQLVLLDAGARYRMYCGDISRTFPVSGTFTAAQRDVYDAVLAARDAAIALVRPGNTIEQVHDAALRTALAALIDLGVLRGTVDELVEKKEEYHPFLPHRTSHWLGLDVHDVGDYRTAGEPRRLEPGMVLTVEPGIYLPGTHDAVPTALRGSGIRIEDDVLVTPSGHEVLTAALPTAALEVETLLRG